MAQAKLPNQNLIDLEKLGHWEHRLSEEATFTPLEISLVCV
jgi:hypothetical protein